MNEPANGFEFLARFRQTNGNWAPKYSDFLLYLESKARQKKAPVSGRFELMSPVGQCGLPAGTWKGLIRQAWEAGMIHATLAGADRLDGPVFEELFLYLHSLGCQVSVVTDGALLDEERIRFFTEHMPMTIRVTGGLTKETCAAIDTGLPIRIAGVDNMACDREQPLFILDWNGTLKACPDGAAADALRDGFRASWEKICREGDSRPEPVCEACVSAI